MTTAAFLDGIQRPAVDLDPAVTSAFCALKAARTSSFFGLGTLK